MTDSSSASAPMPGLGDLLMLLSGNNPLAGISKAIAQFQRGVGDFLAAVENFNQSMEQMNEITGRVNRLLDDVEPPIRALMPQVTRTLNSADLLIVQMNGLPKDVGEMMSLLGDVARRLQPLGQLAETAGGMFGLKPFTNLLTGASRGTTTPHVAPEPWTAAPDTRTTAPKTAAKKTAAKKTAAKTTAARTSGAKKAPATKTTAKKATATKKAPVRKAAGTRPVTKKASARS